MGKYIDSYGSKSGAETAAKVRVALKLHRKVPEHICARKLVNSAWLKLY